jgi:hypothetical protein
MPIKMIVNGQVMDRPAHQTVHSLSLFLCLKQLFPISRRQTTALISSFYTTHSNRKFELLNKYHFTNCIKSAGLSYSLSIPDSTIASVAENNLFRSPGL